MKVWAKNPDIRGEKFLVVRRDGSVPKWPHFVMGARDSIVPVALRAYADEAAARGLEPEYVQSVRDLADDFDAYREREGLGDPDAGPHRTDDPAVIDMMCGGEGFIQVRHELVHLPKTRRPA